MASRVILGHYEFDTLLELPSLAVYIPVRSATPGLYSIIYM